MHIISNADFGSQVISFEMVQKEMRPRPRGRPRSYDPEVALKRATEAFWKSGYSGTSLDDLAAATGMNRPSLYAGFGDKRAPVQCEIDCLEQRRLAGLVQAFDQDAPGIWEHHIDVAQRLEIARTKVLQTDHAGTSDS